MSYLSGSPNGKLYIGTVKWSNDYKHVMLFDTRIKRNEFLESHLTKIRDDFVYADPNGYVDIKGDIADVETINYAYYKNDSDMSGTHYCCFVTHYEYIAPKTTRLYLEIDVFQMYHYTTTYYQSFIDRAIVSKSVDNQQKNFLPEPVSAPLIFESVVNDILTQADWQPVWVLHSASYYNSSDGEYHYEGKGTNNTYGEYGRFINSQSEMKTLLKMYGRKPIGEALNTLLEQINDDINNFSANGKTVLRTIIQGMLSGGVSTVSQWNDMTGLSTMSEALNISEYQDHRDELIGLYAIPKWLYDGYHDAGGDTNYADNQRIDVSKTTTEQTPGTTLNINTSTLANGYTPRNKKMLSSVCRAYVLANKTGLQIPFKPELFGSHSTAQLHLYGITMATGGYQYYVTNYEDYQKAYGEVAYNSERRVGYDANTGINKALAVIGAGVGIASGVGQVASGNVGGMLAGAGNIGQNLVSAIDSLGTKEQHFGNNGDLLRITGARPQLHWYELNPSESECQAIDNFFDMYGYSIQKHQNPSSYFNNRSNWNYVKTNDINMRVEAPSNYENKLKSIFNSGVTIWHTYNNFGDYSQTNS